ncbi:MAG: tetratricopeptide repeat protein [Anaerolineales bacterium]|nr:tetratricopeptide repeat protein [Anaerolineales bacterium]
MAKHPDAFQTAMNQGHSAAWDQNWDRAAAHYRKALELSDDDPQALTSLGLALIELQDFEGALNCYQKAAKVSPNDPLPLEKIAQLCERMGSLDLAAQAALRGAELYLQNKDIQKAVENWERVTRLDPENLLARSRLAMVYEKSGENSKAVSQYLAFASILHAGEYGESASGDRSGAQNQSKQPGSRRLPQSNQGFQAAAKTRAPAGRDRPAAHGSGAPTSGSQRFSPVGA